MFQISPSLYAMVLVRLQKFIVLTLIVQRGIERERCRGRQRAKERKRGRWEREEEEEEKGVSGVPSFKGRGYGTCRECTAGWVLPATHAGLMHSARPPRGRARYAWMITLTEPFT